jgi:hypothetical protein
MHQYRMCIWTICSQFFAPPFQGISQSPKQLPWYVQWQDFIISALTIMIWSQRQWSLLTTPADVISLEVAGIVLMEVSDAVTLPLPLTLGIMHGGKNFLDCTEAVRQHK